MKKLLLALLFIASAATAQTSNLLETLTNLSITNIIGPSATITYGGNSTLDMRRNTQLALQFEGYGSGMSSNTTLTFTYQVSRTTSNWCIAPFALVWTAQGTNLSVAGTNVDVGAFGYVRPCQIISTVPNSITNAYSYPLSAIRKSARRDQASTISGALAEWSTIAPFSTNGLMGTNAVLFAISTNQGSSISNLNGTEIRSGTVADARIDSAIARLASPTFTGTPAAPTPAANDSTTKIATTAFVMGTTNYGQYKTIATAGGSHIAARVAGTYFLPYGNPIGITGTGTLYPPVLIHIVGADYPTVGGVATKLRIRAVLEVNDVAPTGNFTFGLYPVTRPATSGAAGLDIYTMGTVVTGSNGATFTTPAADSQNTAVSADFSLPANGVYVLGIVTTATVAASSHLHVSAMLQYHNN